jgi:ribosome-associated translation inhibitor RaiA
MKGTENVEVQAETQGPVPDEMKELASSEVRSALRLTDRPILFVRVTLAMAANPAVERPAVARANLDIDGRIVHVQAAGETMRDAVERMADRLRSRLVRTARNWETRRGARPTGAEGEWRHQSLPARPAGHDEVPPADVPPLLVDAVGSAGQDGYWGADKCRLCRGSGTTGSARTLPGEIGWNRSLNGEED